MALSTQVPGCLLTASSDKIVKVWDFKEGKPSFVMSRDVKMVSVGFIRKISNSMGTTETQNQKYSLTF